MSYCRLTRADVYVYDDVRGFLNCCGCSLGDDFHADTAQQMIAHLQQHVDVGHHVPDDVIPAVLADARQDDPDRERRRSAGMPRLPEVTARISPHVCELYAPWWPRRWHWATTALVRGVAVDRESGRAWTHGGAVEAMARASRRLRRRHCGAEGDVDG